MVERPKAVTDIFSQLDQFSDERKILHWKGSFGEYLQIVTEKPQLVRQAHKYLFDAITSRENFFETGENALFGAEKPIKYFTEVLEAASKGLEVRKRIILLVGPPASGKTTLANSLKRGLEEYSKTEEGAIFAIDGCPMNEEPLHLLPGTLRDGFEKTHGVKIEGHLCPHCQEKFGDDPEKIKEAQVKRIVFSENKRLGIGTFKPSDPKSQDLTELVGSVDFSKLAEFGTASDAKAYRFDGELNIANRGVMEFVEMLKSDERFLYVLLDLAQDRVIKAPRFPNIYADEVIISHTNETEYDKYFKNPANEAISDRTIIITMPYNLRISAEEKIYKKLVEQSELVNDQSDNVKIHISPNTLKVAAMFAVLSRLEKSDKPITNVDKMKLYDGQNVADVSPNELKELEEEFAREGMDGISPRYVIDSLSTALIAEGRKCLNPIMALRALRDGLDKHAHTRNMDQDEKSKMKDLIAEVRTEFDEMIKKEVNSAFVYSYAESAQTLFQNYLANVEAFCNKEKIKDPITDEDVDPDEKLMRSIEEQINISEQAKREYRQELMNRVGSMARRGEPVTYTAHQRTKEAIERKLFDDLKDIVKITASTNTPDAEQLQRLNVVADRMIKDNGYCADCANELIKYVGVLLR